MHHSLLSLYLSSIISEKHENNENEETRNDHEAMTLLSNQKNAHVTHGEGK